MTPGAREDPLEIGAYHTGDDMEFTRELALNAATAEAAELVHALYDGVSSETCVQLPHRVIPAAAGMAGTDLNPTDRIRPAYVRHFSTPTYVSDQSRAGGTAARPTGATKATSYTGVWVSIHLSHRSIRLGDWYRIFDTGIDG